MLVSEYEAKRGETRESTRQRVDGAAEGSRAFVYTTKPYQIIHSAAISNIRRDIAINSN
jgi:hypothetical protein